MNTCCLCSNLATAAPKEMWNTPLFESANFVVIPSLGSLVEGWLLLLPKVHVLSMGALPAHLAQELQALKCRIGSVLQYKYRHICVFEHGPSAPNKSVGCSVDHAHLHLVPVAFDLVDAARPFLPADATWSTGGWEDCREASLSDKDYLYVEQPIGVGRICVHAALGSQVLRKAIAAQLGLDQYFNWREHPQLHTVARTIQHLSVCSGEPRPVLS